MIVKSCLNCKYHKKGVYMRCTNFDVILAKGDAYDLSRGTIYVMDARMRNSPCGPEGKLWEPSLWYKIKTWFRNLL